MLGETHFFLQSDLIYKAVAICVTSALTVGVCQLQRPLDQLKLGLGWPDSEWRIEQAKF